jgi:hypothetical protein
MTSEPQSAPEIEPETRPTPQQIDQLIAKYAEAQAEAASYSATAKIAGDAAGEIKIRLTAMTEKWGGRHTEKSKRLAGLHNTATTTTGTLVSVVADKVEKLRVYLGTTKTPELAGEFFVEHTTYSLLKGPGEKLKTLVMGTRLRTKITGMIAACFDIKTKTPSLKVELAELEQV